MIDGDNDTVKKIIPVGETPTFILVAGYNTGGLLECCKIYVADSGQEAVSVIYDNNDTVKRIDVVPNSLPTFILSNGDKTYVAGDQDVSVIDPMTDTLNTTIPLPDFSNYDGTMAMYINNRTGTLMVTQGIPGNDSQDAYSIPIVNNSAKLKHIANQTLLYGFLNYSRIWSEIPGYIPPGFLPTVVQDQAFQHFTKKIYQLNQHATVSIFGCNDTAKHIPKAAPKTIKSVSKAADARQMKNKVKKTVAETSKAADNCVLIQKPMRIGQHPGPIAINPLKHIVYIGYPNSGTVSAINGFTNTVAVGAIFNINPPGSGAIKCYKMGGKGTIYPTNTYIYVDSETKCFAQNNDATGLKFNTWTQSPLTNPNSSTPIAGDEITVDGYHVFTANFKPPPQITAKELFGYLTGAITAAVAVNGVLLLVPGWRRAKNQRAHLRECIQIIDNDVGRSHKDEIEEKIIGYYVDGKLSEDHRQLLNDKISEYYGSVKGSESGA